MKRSMRRPLVASVLFIALGCCNPQQRPLWQSQPVPPPSPRPVLPAVAAPAPPPGFQPAPQSFPGAPPANVPPPAVPAFPTLPPPAPPPSGGAALPPQNAIAQVENRWQPADGGVRLGAPEPITGDDGKPPPRLYPPDKTPEPPLNQQATPLPVGIPQFATAMDNVATGLRPSLDEGLDWLQARGYKTVLQIKLPGENDSADRKQVEKRGMKYASIEVSPRTLTKVALDDFKRHVRDTAGQPLFIYDRDGALAGGLWYLYFRVVEQFSDDVARVRAGALGLREDRDGAQRDMWLAVQKFLEDNAR